MKTLALISAATLALATLPAAAQAPKDAQIASIVVTAEQVQRGDTIVWVHPARAAG